MSTATNTRRSSTTAKALGAIFGIPIVIGLMLFAFLAHLRVRSRRSSHRHCGTGTCGRSA